MTLTQDLLGPPQSCQAARQFKSNPELYGDAHLLCKHWKGVIFLSVTWHMVSVAASSLQGLGTCFKAFIRLKSNAAITLSLQQKSIPEMLCKMHQEAQPYKGMTNQTPFPNTAYSSMCGC